MQKMIKADLLIWKIKEHPVVMLPGMPAVDMLMIASGKYYGGYVNILSPGPGSSLELRGVDPEEVRGFARREIERYRKSLLSEAQEGTVTYEDFSDEACT